MSEEQGFSIETVRFGLKNNLAFFAFSEYSSRKKNNALTHFGNDSMNLNPLILTNIQSSIYFKGKFLSLDHLSSKSSTNFDFIFFFFSYPSLPHLRYVSS